MKHIVYILHTIVVLFRLGFLFSQREWTNNLSQPSYGQISLFSSSGWDSSVTISPLSTQIVITKETSFQHVSLDSIVAWLSDQTQYHDSNFVTTEYLRNQYRSDPNTIENTKKFVNQLVQEFEYDEAYAVIQSGGFSLQQSLDPHIVLHILFNSELINNKDKDLQTIQAFIDQSYKEQRITDKEQQRYSSLIILLQGDKEKFLTILRELHTNNMTGAISDVIQTLQQRVNQAQQGRDIPAYYSDGMITLWLFEHGYTIISKQLSLQLLASYPNYILPQQILAYSHIILKERREAKSYFLNLMNSDNSNSTTYQFFVGVSSYRMNDYVNALLYLNQIPSNTTLSTDIIRYKILSYIAIKDYNKLVKQFVELLWKADLRASDMLLFWEQAVFEPYSKNTDYEILNKDWSLLQLYNKRCISSEFKNNLCTLWEIAERIVSKQYYQLNDTIIPIVNNYPYAYLYIALWDSTRSLTDKEIAKKYYVQAMSLTKDPQIREVIKKKLTNIL